MPQHYTRFRAYQLKTAGSSMSISVNNHFTLIEARYNDDNKEHIKWELKNLGISHIDVLHITSWDKDHCNLSELQSILKELRPQEIEHPNYKPHTETGEKCYNLIRTYCVANNKTRTPVSTAFVNDSIANSERLKGKDVFMNPVEISEEANDNSVVKFFRRGSFQVLSLGDCEADEISERLQNNDILKHEVDVLILAHHGSVHSVTTPEFLRVLNPKVGICTVDYANKFGHPDKGIVTWLKEEGIDYISTKTGDVIIQTYDNKNFKVSNYVSNNERKESVRYFTNKTFYPDDKY